KRLEGASNPAFVAGPDIDASGAWNAAVALAEKQRLPVWATPPPGGGRLGFPEGHPNFRGSLPPAIGPTGETLAAYDLGIAAGPPIFPSYPNIPGPLLAEGTELVAITSDPDEAARAPMGEAIVANVALTLAALAGRVPDSERPAPPSRPAPEEVELTNPMSPSTAVRTLAQAFPPEGMGVLEAPAGTPARR